MSEPRIMRMEPNGPADVGMTEWDAIPPEALTTGTPVQRGFVYLDDAKNGLTSGVWDCTPMTEKPGAYGVNEFMVVLEGAVTIVDEGGSEETIRTGEAFIMPKGMPSTWKQTEYIRKFYVIFDDASGLAPEDPSALKVLRPRPGDSLAEIEVDTSVGFVGDVPVQHAHSYFTDMTGQMTCRPVAVDAVRARARPVPAPRADASARRLGHADRRRRRRTPFQRRRHAVRADGRGVRLEELRDGAQVLLHLHRAAGQGPVGRGGIGAAARCRGSTPNA